MFQNTDFWIGLGIGVVAGVFGYKLMSEREQQLLAMQQPAAAGRAKRCCQRTRCQQIKRYAIHARSLLSLASCTAS